MIVNQYIVICLKDSTEEDPATYVQTTRRRFGYEDAKEYIKGISPERKPVIVVVPYIDLNEKNYPIKA